MRKSLFLTRNVIVVFGEVLLAESSREKHQRPSVNAKVSVPRTFKRFAGCTSAPSEDAAATFSFFKSAALQGETVFVKNSLFGLAGERDTLTKAYLYNI